MLPAALLAQGLALGFSASASPGPFQALLLERSARLGPRHALRLALVPLVSDPPVIAACLLALSGLPGALLRLLSLAGGALLRLPGRLDAPCPVAPGPAGPDEPAAARPDGFWSAALVNLLNPNVWIFWSLVGGPILAGALRAEAPQPLAFLAGFYLVAHRHQRGHRAGLRGRGAARPAGGARHGRPLRRGPPGHGAGAALARGRLSSTAGDGRPTPWPGPRPRL